MSREAVSRSNRGVLFILGHPDPCFFENNDLELSGNYREFTFYLYTSNERIIPTRNSPSAAVP